MDTEEDEEAGVPEWVVTYGDMMSLLLTFFIMLVSLSEIVADSKYRAILESLQEVFGYRTAVTVPPGPYFPLNALITKLDTLGSFKDGNEGGGGIKTEAPEGKNVQVYRMREGNALRVGAPVFFPPGATSLTAEAREELTKIRTELAGKRHKVEVRSHAAPLYFQLPHDQLLERTYENGRIVMLFLEGSEQTEAESEVALATEQAAKIPKIEHERLRITAAADSEPPTDSGDSRMAEMNRVEVLIFDALTEDFVGTESTVD